MSIETQVKAGEVARTIRDLIWGEGDQHGDRLAFYRRLLVELRKIISQELWPAEQAEGGE